MGGVEDAFVYFNDIGGSPVDVAVGQFQISDPMVKWELRLEFQDYAVYRARVGDQPADLTYDRGIMVVAEVAGCTVTGEAVNGNGRGPAESDRRLDNDAVKSVFGHMRRDVSRHLRLGAMGDYGRQEGAQPFGPVEENKVWMLGPPCHRAGGTKRPVRSPRRQSPHVHPRRTGSSDEGRLCRTTLSTGHKPLVRDRAL